MRLWNRVSIGDEAGLTLVEILVSMMLFMTVSSGVAGTLTSGLKTAVDSRLETIAKSRAQEQIEEMRSRIFHVPYSNNDSTGTVKDIDLLDRYYPGLGDSEDEGWLGSYNSLDSSYTLESPADPDTGMVITVVTRFVNNAGETIIPPTSYNSNSLGNDIPPSNLVAVKVTTAWGDRSGDHSYQLDSLISSTGQTVQGAGDATGEQGCSSNSSSSIDVVGGTSNTQVITLGITVLDLDANAGQAYAAIPQTGCENEAEAQGRGGQLSLAVSGLEVEVPLIGTDTGLAMAPPDDFRSHSSLGIMLPLPAGPTIELLQSSSRAEASVQVLGANTAEAETFVGGETVSISELTSIVWVPLVGVKQWLFLNPLIQMEGGPLPQSRAYLLQADNQTDAFAEVHYDQIEMMPLLPKGSILNPAPPEPDFGLVVIRDFTATVTASANGTTGGGSNIVDYSATVGLFNPNNSASCEGDACYDWYAINPGNPLQSINLNQSKYSLQKLLLAEFNSKTTAQLNSASPIDADGNPSVFLQDGVMTISSKIALQVNRNSSNGQTSLLGELGLQRIQLGSFDVRVSQG